VSVAADCVEVPHQLSFHNVQFASLSSMFPSMRCIILP
jgi:hypothetical protein